MLKKLLLLSLLIIGLGFSQAQAVTGYERVKAYITELEKQEHKTSEGARKYQTTAITALSFLATSIDADGTEYGITDTRKWESSENANYLKLINLIALARYPVNWVPIKKILAGKDDIVQKHAQQVKDLYLKAFAKKVTSVLGLGGSQADHGRHIVTIRVMLNPETQETINKLILSKIGLQEVNSDRIPLHLTIGTIPHLTTTALTDVVSKVTEAWLTQLNLDQDDYDFMVASAGNTPDGQLALMLNEEALEITNELIAELNELLVNVYKVRLKEEAPYITLTRRRTTPGTAAEISIINAFTKVLPENKKNFKLAQPMNEVK